MFSSREIYQSSGFVKGLIMLPFQKIISGSEFVVGLPAYSLVIKESPCNVASWSSHFDKTGHLRSRQYNKMVNRQCVGIEWDEPRRSFDFKAAESAFRENREPLSLVVDLSYL
jgi:hypothetical protein